MLQRFVRRTAITLVAFLMTLTAGISRADDTELYFSQARSSGNTGNEILPNILFILDTSTSMSRLVDNKTRMEHMQDALREIITNAGNVRMGLMRFTADEGGSISFPIADINTPAADVVSEPDDTRLAFRYSIIAFSDDAEEARVADTGRGIAVGDVNINDASLTIDNTQSTGLRFQNVVIPQGARITEAQLVLTASNSDSTTSDAISIQAEQADDSSTFSTTVADISNRNRGMKSTRWTLPVTTTDTTISSCTDGICTGDTLAAVIQDVTDRANWCGGNALTLILSGTNSSSKAFYSYDGNSSRSARLDITYDTTRDVGCTRLAETARIATSTDDASNTNTAHYLLPFLRGNTNGLRFQDIDIPQGTTIQSAEIAMTAVYDNADSIDITIFGEDEDAAATYGNVNTRTKTSASVSYQPPDWSRNGVYKTPNLTTIVQEIINRPGWQAGNPMAFIFEATGTGSRIAYSYGHDISKVARLSITYQSSSNVSSIKTVRSRLIEIVDDYPVADNTPITSTLYEAAHYWRGESMVSGKSRISTLLSSETRLSHPGSYCSADNNCPGANTGSYPPYGVDNPVGCSEDNLDVSACRNRRIAGSPVYISPFQSDSICAANYQVLLTDGLATSTFPLKSRIESEFRGSDFGVDTDGDGEGDGQCRTTNTLGNPLITAEECAIDLVEFLSRNDQSSNLDNDQTVTTYTVGFNLPQTQFIKDMAAAGGGSFYEASTASDLITVFNTILAEVDSQSSSLTAPSLATNAFNRLLSRNEVYFSLFIPELNASWDGNVKKYKLCIDSDPDGDGDEDCKLGSFLDATGALATDTQTGRFRNTAKSLWSDTVDGLETTKGGTGAEFDDFEERIIYTETGTAPAKGTSLSGDGYKITAANWDSSDLAAVRTAVCPTPETTSGSDCEDRMLWLLGKVLTSKETDVDADTRWTISDVLHSNPAIITYGGNDSDDDGVIDTFFDKLVYGSNDGALHFVNASTGKEEWSFMPQSVLNNQQALFTNAEGEHIYGMDLTPVLNIKDVDGDSIIETADGDYVHIIAGMRRGGKFIYALDVSANISSAGGTVVPKFLWRIEGGVTDSDYERLAYTWSRPVLGKITIAKSSSDSETQGTREIKPVMVFGGGYDNALDSGFGTAATGDNNNQGNMIFIADPADGSLIFSIGGTDSGADIEVAEMKYAIPSRVTLLDSDRDGIDDRLYVGDTGGQVWRVDLADDIYPDSVLSPEGSSVVGRLATISTPGTEAEERRFFEPPSVVQVTDTLYAEAANSEYDYVLLGTGNRANPLNTVTKDRLYAFRDYTTGKMSRGGTDSSPTNLAKDYPRTDGAPISHSESDLIDITTDVLDGSSTIVDSSFGWYYDFFTGNGDTAGEKVLSAPVTIAKKVLFTSYTPDQNNNLNPCTINKGSGNAYHIDILSTKAILDWDADGTIEDIADRKTSLGSGLPSDVVPVFTEEGVIGIVSAGGGVKQLGELTDLLRYRAYWYEDNPPDEDEDEDEDENNQDSG